MEPVTHFLTGACLGRAGFNRKTAYATLAMTLAAEAPDLDVLWGLQGPVAGFQHHRGITHTLIAVPFIALVVTGAVWLFHRFRRKPPKVPVRWALVWLFSCVAVLSHLLLDFTNNYGLRPFFPFNPRWYSWDIVFIFEPVMFLALLAALVMPSLFGLADREMGVRKPLFRGRAWAIGALVFIILLYALRNAEHRHAERLVREAAIGKEPIRRIGVEPFPINPFKWYAVSESTHYYQTSLVNTQRDLVDPDAGSLIYKPESTLATLAAKRSLLGQVYLDWSEFPLVSDRGLFQPPGKNVEPPQPGWTTVEFDDLRFEYMGMVLGNTSKARTTPLAGWVYVGPQREIEGMIMGGKQQE
jgi:inner membrane protein